MQSAHHPHAASKEHAADSHAAMEHPAPAAKPKPASDKKTVSMAAVATFVEPSGEVETMPANLASYAARRTSLPGTPVSMAARLSVLDWQTGILLAIGMVKREPEETVLCIC